VGRGRGGSACSRSFCAPAHRLAAGAARHHSADDQPISQPDQKFLVGPSRSATRNIVSIANTTLNQTGQAIEAIASDHAGVPHHQASAISLFMNWYNARIAAGGALSHGHRNGCAAKARALSRTRSNRGAGRPRRCAGSAPTLFSSISSSLITLFLILLPREACSSGFAQWGIWDAVWSVPGANNTGACRAGAGGFGACWAGIPEKFRFIFFGTYPYDRTVASRGCDADLHCAVLSVEPTQAVAPRAGIRVGWRADPDRIPDVGGHLRTVLCVAGSTGADCQ